MRNLSLLAALLLAAPLFPQHTALGPDPKIDHGRFEWFTLSETREQLMAALGKPTVTAEFGHDFESWQYQIGIADHHEFSHQIVLRKGGSIVSITRNYEKERSVDALFPDSMTTVHHLQVDGTTRYSVRLRRLPNDIVLMAMGVSKPGQTTGQIVLISATELRHFHPWLYSQLR